MSATQGFDLQRVQKLRKAALLVGLIGVVGLAFVSRSIGGETMLHEGLEAFGLGLIVVCIVGRAWCSLYIGGRKKAEIVGIADPIRSAAIRCMCSASWGRSAWGRRRGA